MFWRVLLFCRHQDRQIGLSCSFCNSFLIIYYLFCFPSTIFSLFASGCLRILLLQHERQQREKCFVQIDTARNFHMLFSGHPSNCMGQCLVKIALHPVIVCWIAAEVDFFQGAISSQCICQSMLPHHQCTEWRKQRSRRILPLRPSILRHPHSYVPGTRTAPSRTKYRSFPQCIIPLQGNASAQPSEDKNIGGNFLSCQPGRRTSTQKRCDNPSKEPCRRLFTLHTIPSSPTGRWYDQLQP